MFPKGFQNITEFPTHFFVEGNEPTYLNSLSLLLEMMFFAFCVYILKAGVCLKKCYVRFSVVAPQLRGGFNTSQW